MKFVPQGFPSLSNLPPNSDPFSNPFSNPLNLKMEIDPESSETYPSRVFMVAILFGIQFMDMPWSLERITCFQHRRRAEFVFSNREFENGFENGLEFSKARAEAKSNVT